MKEKITRGLLVKEEWLEKILRKKRRKTWEIRGSKTKHKGEKIALIQTGSWKIIGICKIDDVQGPFTLKELKQNVSKHQIPTNKIRELTKNSKKKYAWVLESAENLKKPVTLKRKKGAQKWVKLSNYKGKEIERQL